MASILATSSFRQICLCLLGNEWDGERKDSLELALRSVAAEHSERPMYLVLPALRISSRAGMDSSNGVSGFISLCGIGLRKVCDLLGSIRCR